MSPNKMYRNGFKTMLIDRKLTGRHFEKLSVNGAVYLIEESPFHSLLQQADSGRLERLAWSCAILVNATVPLLFDQMRLALLR